MKIIDLRLGVIQGGMSVRSAIHLESLRFVCDEASEEYIGSSLSGCSREIVGATLSAVGRVYLGSSVPVRRSESLEVCSLY
jgi:hypothetical protein